MARTRSSLKRKAEADADAPQDTATSPQTKLPVRAKDEEELPSQSPAQPAQGKGSLTVFDDDDDDDVGLVSITPTTNSAGLMEMLTGKGPLAPALDEEEEEESDDDAAPEAVSTSQAASSIKKSTQAAQKAAQEEAAAQKRKRQQRDALFKQQAEERKKAEEAEKAEKAKKEALMEDDGDVAASEPQTGRKRLDRVPIPNVLPAEFLTDSSSEDEDGEDENSVAGPSRPKRRKVAAVEKSLARQDRGPRDERVGSTIYRVAEKTDDRLAPKSKQYSKGRKDMLLKRNREAVKSRGGFFKK